MHNDASSIPRVVHVLNPVTDEAIAMAALSSMAESLSSSSTHAAPGSDQMTVSAEQVASDLHGSEHVTMHMEQIATGSEHNFTSSQLQMAIDLSSANVVADDLT